jgi:hypothetical protein
MMILKHKIFNWGDIFINLFKYNSFIKLLIFAVNGGNWLQPKDPINNSKYTDQHQDQNKTHPRLKANINYSYKQQNKNIKLSWPSFLQNSCIKFWLILQKNKHKNIIISTKYAKLTQKLYIKSMLHIINKHIKMLKSRKTKKNK